MGAVKIGRDVVGGAGVEAGSIISGGKLASLTIGGSVIGGSGTRTGRIFISDSAGTVKIGGDVRGGAGTQTGSIELFMNAVVGSISIAGGLIGGTNNSSGVVLGGDSTVVGKLSIGGDIVGGNGDLASARSLLGYVEVGSLGTVVVSGSVIAGTNPGAMALSQSGGINTVNGGITSLTIKGSVLGNAANRAVISSYADTAPGKIAFGKIVIGGSVVRGDILGGFDYDTEANDDAQIGSVLVGGDWIASNLVAGVDDNDGFFGDANDTGGGGNTALFSKIASITILGAAYGTPANVSNTDRYAFTAEFIGALKIGGTAFPLNATPRDQNSLSDSLLAVGPTGDLRVREL
jgi:hypothetical protein